MRKNLVLGVLIAVLAVWFTSCASSQQSEKQETSVINRVLERGELVVGTAGSMPPFNFTSRSGEILGYEIDMARYLAKSLGVELRIETMDFSDLLPALEAGKLDLVMSSMTMTAERNTRVAFVGPYFISGKSFVTKIQTVATVEDVSEVNAPNWTFTALSGSTSQAFVEELLPDANHEFVADYNRAIELLRANSVDALVADLPICALTAMRYANEGFIYHTAPLTYEPIGIALPADDSLLINWLENRLGSLEGSGILEGLVLYWFSSADWIGQLP
jgi:polar amino acid transport system substrate-binding protein